jgi:hypothetical protein
MTTDPIHVDLELECSPGRAFEVYVDDIARWWDPMYTADAATFDGVLIKPGVGGAVVESHRDGRCIVWGRVTVWQPGRRLAYTSVLAQTAEHPSEITLAFAATADGCAVAFDHGGWNAGNASDRARFNDWPKLLARYVAAAAT